MKIHIARNGQSLGQLDEEQLTEQIEKGCVSYDDLAWTEGMAEWQPLRTICAPPQGTPPPPPTPPPPAALPPVTGTPTGAVASNPAIWNPGAAALWCLLFTPAFGPFLHWRNALALGRFEEVAANQKWFCAGLIGVVICAFSDDFSSYTVLSALMGGLWIILPVAWYFTTGTTQIEFVQRNFPNGYAKKGWLKPIGMVVVIYACLIALGAALPDDQEGAAAKNTPAAANGKPGSPR